MNRAAAIVLSIALGGCATPAQVTDSLAIAGQALALAGQGAALYLELKQAGKGAMK